MKNRIIAVLLLAAMLISLLSLGAAASASGAEPTKTVTFSGMSMPRSSLTSGSVFPVCGTIASVNPITQIYAAIYSGSKASGTPVQEYSISPKGITSYSLKDSALDYAMEFNKLPNGDYTFIISVTECAECNGGHKGLVSTVRSTFSVGKSAPHSSDVYFGIDVSNHQGYINWEAACSEIDFAILRCGYGNNSSTQDDERWYYNARECERLGIPYGVYLFSYAVTDAEAQSEAEHTLRLLEGLDPDLPVFYDLEHESTVGSLSNADILRHAKIYCSALSNAGYQVGIYASLSWWNNRLTSSDYDQWVKWVARWDYSSSGREDCTVWQYSSSGSVNGVSGRVDVNYWYGALPGTGCAHSFSSEQLKAASCTENGEVRQNCTKCGESFTELIKAHGHCYSEKTVQADCTHEGCREHTCLYCGDTCKTDVTAKLPHEFESGKCIHCGEPDPDYHPEPVKISAGNESAIQGASVTVPVYICDNLGFSGFDLVISYDKTAMTLTDITKGEVLIGSSGTALSKSISGSSVSFNNSADISSDGVLLNLSFTVKESAAAKDYSIGISLKNGDAASFRNADGSALLTELAAGTLSVSEKPHTHTYAVPSFRWNGYSCKATFTCTGCSEQQELSCSVTCTVTKEPSCKETGTRTYTASIIFEGKTYTSAKNTSVSKTAHSPDSEVIENENPASCTERGSYDEVVYCSVCSTELSRVSRETEALGHALSYHSGRAATNTEAGWEPYYTCSRCSYTSYKEIPSFDAEISIATSDKANNAGVSVIPSIMSSEDGTEKILRLSFITAEGGVMKLRHVAIVSYIGAEGSPVLADENDSFILPAQANVLHIECAMLGDPSGDGFIDATDAAYVLKIVAQKKTPSALESLAGDVNGDGKIDASDAARILKYAAKKIYEM